VLEAQPENLKALFRRSKARIERERVEDALEDIRAAEVVATKTNDTKALSEIERLKEEIERQSHAISRETLDRTGVLIGEARKEVLEGGDDADGTLGMAIEKNVSGGMDELSRMVWLRNMFQKNLNRIKYWIPPCAPQRSGMTSVAGMLETDIKGDAFIREGKGERYLFYHIDVKMYWRGAILPEAHKSWEKEHKLEGTCRFYDITHSTPVSEWKMDFERDSRWPMGRYSDIIEGYARDSLMPLVKAKIEDIMFQMRKT